MATTDQCRIDPSRPCGACSAPGPDQCPYTYLLADLFSYYDPSALGPGDDGPDDEPPNPEQDGSPEHAPA
jgi:hypothetical protein